MQIIIKSKLVLPLQLFLHTSVPGRLLGKREILILGGEVLDVLQHVVKAWLCTGWLCGRAAFGVEIDGCPLHAHVLGAYDLFSFS